jgi:hypothetical protein
MITPHVLTLWQEQVALFKQKITQKADEILASGSPLSLELIVVIAQKPTA